VAVALLCGILQSLQSDYLGKSTAQIVYFVAYMGALIPILSILTECITLSQNTVTSLGKQMSAIFPLMITLMAAVGGNVSVAIFQPSVAFLSNTMVALIRSVVFPITIAIIVFSMAGNLFGDLKTDRFSKFFKSVNKWCMGIGISVFGLFLTVQGLTAASYDGIARRAAKYAIGAGVPIVGGLLSGGFDLAVAGGILIKNSLGNFSVFLLIAVLLEPITTMIGANLLFRLTAAIAHPFGESKISTFMEETAENLNYCTAGVLFTAFLYFLTVLLLVCASGVFL
jgi:stage III sporulation protein AE